MFEFFFYPEEELSVEFTANSDRSFYSPVLHLAIKPDACGNECTMLLHNIYQSQEWNWSKWAVRSQSDDGLNKIVFFSKTQLMRTFRKTDGYSGSIVLELRKL